MSSTSSSIATGNPANAAAATAASAQVPAGAQGRPENRVRDQDELVDCYGCHVKFARKDLSAHKLVCKQKQGPRGDRFREQNKHTFDINVNVGGHPPAAPVPVVPMPAVAQPAAAPAPVIEAVAEEVVVQEGDDVLDSNVPFIAKQCYGDLKLSTNRLIPERQCQKYTAIVAFTLFYLCVFGAFAVAVTPLFMRETAVPEVRAYSSYDFRPEFDVPTFNMDFGFDYVSERLSSAFEYAFGGVRRRHNEAVSELFSSDVTPAQPDQLVEYGVLAFLATLFLGSVPLFAVVLSYFRVRPDYKQYRLLGSVYTARKWRNDRRHVTFKTVPVDSDDFEPDAKYLAYRLTECIDGVVVSRKVYISYEMLIALRTPKLANRFTTVESMRSAFDDTMAFAKTQTQINLNRELEAGFDIVANTCRLFVVQLALMRFPDCDLNWVRL